MCYSSFEFLLLLNIINATITSYLDYFLNLAVMFSNSNIICIKQVSFLKYPFFKKDLFTYLFIALLLKHFMRSHISSLCQLMSTFFAS